MVMPKNMPVKPIKKPSDLAGITNGKIPESLLVEVGKRKSKMHHTAARGWRCLMAHLTPHLEELGADDWDLASVDPRTYQRQWEMFDGRTYKDGRYLPSSMWAAYEKVGGWWGKRDNGQIQEYIWQAPNSNKAEVWRRKGGMAMAARPGNSPHGWGLAVDLAIDDDDDSIADPITEAVVRFLMKDDLALKCGWAWSTPSEPWHLQWYVGDDVPPLVIAWEKGQKPDPKPDPTLGPSTEIDNYPKGSEKHVIPIDYGIPGVDSWWTEMAITPKGLQWSAPVSSGGNAQNAKIREVIVAVSLPRAPRLKNDADVITLMQTIGTFGPVPSTFMSNQGLKNAWTANLNKAR